MSQREKKANNKISSVHTFEVNSKKKKPAAVLPVKKSKKEKENGSNRDN